MTNGGPPPLDVPQLVRDAIERCQDHLSPTPLEYSMYLSEKIDGEVWLKLDSMQRTSSFKFRGAVNKILSLTEAELDKGVVTASTGNYALAVAEAVRIRKRRATIYVAEDLGRSRLELLKSHGLDLVIHGKFAWDAEKEARRVAEEQDKIYVSPYNGPGDGQQSGYRFCHCRSLCRRWRACRHQRQNRAIRERRHRETGW